MKKTLLFLVVSLLALASNAQSKLTKESVLGEWIVYSVEVKNSFYYSKDEDSLKLTDSLKTAMTKAGMDPKLVEQEMKKQFIMFMTFFYRFDADGKAELTMGFQDPVKSTYTVDEASSTINMLEPKGTRVSIKGEMRNDKMLLEMPEMEGLKMWILFQKARNSK